MAAERREDDSRELRLEGAGLVIVGGLLVALVAGAFFLGRWVERRARPPLTFQSAETDLLEQVPTSDESPASERDADFFDHMEGREKQAEPARQAQDRKPDPPAQQAQAPRPQPARAASTEKAPSQAPGGAFHVQVFAGRNRDAAERLVSDLETAGYTVQTLTENEGQSALYKVRVGGYPTEDRAREVARELQKKGHVGAWVARLE